MTEIKTPLQTILDDYKLTNHDLVAAALAEGKQLSHKTVQKARTGSRGIGRSLQFRVVDALNAAANPEKPWKREDVFPEEPKTPKGV